MLAAGVKPAARGRVGRAGQVASEQQALALAVWFGQGYCRQQGLGVGVARRGKQGLRVGELNHTPEIHHRDLGGDVLDHRQVVGNKDIGQAKLLLQVLQEVQNLCLHRHVERGDSLVTNNQLRLHRQGPRNADALALAT